MTDPAVKAVMRVLAEHPHLYSFDGSHDGDVVVACRCGQQMGIEWAGEAAHKIHVAREVVAALDPVMRKAKAEALREAADKWQVGSWTVLITGNTLGKAQAVTDWLRERADRIEADRD